MLDSPKIFIDKCVEIAEKEGFDGWLFNIENELDEPSKMVSLLGDFTAKMHEKVPGSQVIWYDSVTKDGDLKWQNELNEKNCDFFNVCDGIFLNYTWTEDNLTSSANFNPDRKHDIYVGIDVFGRGCFGGGGLSCDKGKLFTFL